MADCSPGDTAVVQQVLRSNVPALLGVGPHTSPQEVQRRFRQLAARVHPDRNAAPDARRAFQQVQEAYRLAMEFLEARDAAAATTPSTFVPSGGLEYELPAVEATEHPQPMVADVPPVLPLPDLPPATQATHPILAELPLPAPLWNALDGLPLPPSTPQPCSLPRQAVTTSRRRFDLFDGPNLEESLPHLRERIPAPVPSKPVQRFDIFQTDPEDIQRELSCVQRSSKLSATLQRDPPKALPGSPPLDLEALPAPPPSALPSTGSTAILSSHVLMPGRPSTSPSPLLARPTDAPAPVKPKPSIFDPPPPPVPQPRAKPQLRPSIFED